MAESGCLPLPPANPEDALAERWATSNLYAFLFWLEAARGRRLLPGDSRGGDQRSVALAALRAWAGAEPQAAATAILAFAGDGFASARLAAGLLLQADLRPDDRVLVLGTEPDWLPQALGVTRGRSPTEAEATVLIGPTLPPVLPPGLRRVILTGGRPPAATPAALTVSTPSDWLWPAVSN